MTELLDGLNECLSEKRVKRGALQPEDVWSQCKK